MTRYNAGARMWQTTLTMRTNRGRMFGVGGWGKTPEIAHDRALDNATRQLEEGEHFV